MKRFIISFLFLVTTMTNAHNLVRMRDIDSTIYQEMPYKTTANFTSKQVYPACAEAYLCKDVALRLKVVQDELRCYGYSLKIWDAYRPHTVQFIFWELVPDKRYVADPTKGSSHNRGAAVDVTLVTLDGHEVAMPTVFDCFDETAHADYLQLPAEVLERRELLKKIMIKHGFKPFATEWWHFNAETSQPYPVLDISFEELACENQ